MSTAVAVLRTPYCRVNAGGIDILANPQSDGANAVQGPNTAGVGVLAVSITYGFDLQVAEATVTCTDKPGGGVTYGSQIQIYLGANQGSGPLTGQLIMSKTSAEAKGVRFQGTIVEFDYTHYPHSVDLVCRGWLYAAQKYQVNGSTPLPGDPFPENGGIDLSNQGNGAPDGVIVSSTILQAAALATEGMIGIPLGDILGTPFIFGSVLPENCRWTEGQSALDAIGMFDAVCLGYRTFDTPGFVVRKQISARPDPSNVKAVFTEGKDILSGTGQYSILNTQGTFTVTGGSRKNGATFSFALAGSNPFTGAPEQTSSPLIEKSGAADPGPGLSCEDVANWRRDEMDRPLAVVSFDTPRDDLLVPGDTIQVLSNWRLGATSQYYWLQNVQTTLTEQGVFTQTLTCVGDAS